MKKILSICAIALCLGFAANAQNPEKKNHGNKQQLLESEKVAFITRVVDITPEEAGAFWALYNKYEKAQKENFKAEREAYKALNAGLKEEGRTDAEIETLLKAYIAAKEKNTDIHIRHIAEYKKVIGPRKTAKFFSAQERFRRQQINRLRHKNKPDHEKGQKPGAPRA